MKRILPFALLAFAFAAHADGIANLPGSITDGFGGVKSNTASGGGSSAGFPGNVVSGSKGWWGFRAFSTAYATALGKIANICNAGDANCADVSSTSGGDFNVATATGAPLNCGGAGGTCTIKTLYDQSGALACTGAVACDVTNATVAARPTLVLNCSGSLPCMACTATQSLSSVATFPGATIPQPNTVSTVSKRTSGVALSIVADGGALFGFDGANTAALYAGAVADSAATVTDNALHAIQYVLNDGNSTITADGSSTTGLAPGNTINWGSGTRTTLLCNTANPFTGQVMEAGVWGTAFSATQQANMNTNQHLYWFPAGSPGAVVAAIVGGFL
jgi:hypothetical protein